MKKMARLTALLLIGALLLVLTACGAETEQQAKQRLLEEINSYRESIHLEPLVEVEQLSEAEQVYIAPFRTANTTVLPESETAKTYAKWQSLTRDWSYYDDFGWDWDIREDGERISFLTAEVPANTPEGNADLQAALRSSGVFDAEDGTDIGIAVVTIKGQMYWSCCIFRKNASPSPQA